MSFFFPGMLSLLVGTVWALALFFFPSAVRKSSFFNCEHFFHKKKCPNLNKIWRWQQQNSSKAMATASRAGWHHTMKRSPTHWVCKVSRLGSLGLEGSVAELVSPASPAAQSSPALGRAVLVHHGCLQAEAALRRAPRHAWPSSVRSNALLQTQGRGVYRGESIYRFWCTQRLLGRMVLLHSYFISFIISAECITLKL